MIDGRILIDELRRRTAKRVEVSRAVKELFEVVIVPPGRWGAPTMNRMDVYSPVCALLGWNCNNDDMELITDVLREMGVATVNHSNRLKFRGLQPKPSPGSPV